MEEKAFNLVDSPWIKVLLPTAEVQEVSLKDAVLKAHTFVDLAGENQPQNFAVLRMLLALLYTIFCRVDSEGRPHPLAGPDVNVVSIEDDAEERWRNLWEAEHFPEKPIEDYLAAHYEEFWLFHPTRPFWQAPIQKGIHFEAAKLIGDLSESNNKIRLFSSRSGAGKKKVPYAEAARWLLFVNAFDDSAAKTGTGVGWVGKLGMIQAVGDNLFETLLLNLVFLKDGDTKWEEAPSPLWERVPRVEPTKIPVPDDPAALLTLPSRRLLLQREDGAVSGYLDYGGDFFEDKNPFAEQMSAWNYKNNSFSPKPNDPSKQMWRSFANYFIPPSNNTDIHTHLPGIVSWLTFLQSYQEIGKDITFRTISLQYKNNTTIINMSSDELIFNIRIIFEKLKNDVENEKYLRTDIEKEIKNCEKISNVLSKYQNYIFIADGGDNKKEVSDLKEQYYISIDNPFRFWLSNLKASDDREEINEKFCEWEKKSKQIALNLAKELFRNTSEKAYSGRYLKIDDKDKKGKGKNGKRKKDKDKEILYSAPKAFVAFLGELNRIYPAKE